jgi:hypothetical protein
MYNVGERGQIEEKMKIFPALPKESQILTLPSKPECADSMKLIQETCSGI